MVFSPFIFIIRLNNKHNKMEAKLNNNKGKKPTKGTLEKAIRDAVVLVPKDKETKSVFFDDKWLRLTVTDDYAVIATGAHQHIFNKITANGVSRAYLYTQRFVDIALETDCVVKDAKGETTRSYAKLFEMLNAKEDKTEYNLCWYIDLWLSNIFSPLYQISEDELSSFVVYEQYLHNVARSQVLLSEHKEDMTNVEFVDTILANVKKYIEGMEERVIIHKMTDKEREQAEIDALEENMSQQEKHNQNEEMFERRPMTDEERDYIVNAQKNLKFGKDLPIFGENDGKKVCVKVYNVSSGLYYSPSEDDKAYLFIDSKYLEITHFKYEHEIDLDSSVRLTHEGIEFVRKELKGLKSLPAFFDVMLYRGFQQEQGGR